MRNPLRGPRGLFVAIVVFGLPFAVAGGYRLAPDMPGAVPAAPPAASTPRATVVKPAPDTGGKAAAAPGRDTDATVRVPAAAYPGPTRGDQGRRRASTTAPAPTLSSSPTSTAPSSAPAKPEPKPDDAGSSAPVVEPVEPVEPEQPAEPGGPLPGVTDILAPSGQ